VYRKHELKPMKKISWSQFYQLTFIVQITKLFLDLSQLCINEDGILTNKYLYENIMFTKKSELSIV